MKSYLFEPTKSNVSTIVLFCKYWQFWRNKPALQIWQLIKCTFTWSINDSDNINFFKCVQNCVNIRVFRKLTTLTILTSEALLREKNPVTKCYPSGIRTQAASDFKSNTILSTLT